MGLKDRFSKIGRSVVSAGIDRAEARISAFRSDTDAIRPITASSPMGEGSPSAEAVHAGNVPGASVINEAMREVDWSSEDAMAMALAKAQDGDGSQVGEPKALYWDPYSLVEQLGYKERPSAITYATLNSMVWKVPLLNSIIQTRVNQVAAFCVPQASKFGHGFRIRMREIQDRPTPADKKEARRLERFLETTGYTDDPRVRPTFEQLMRKTTRDTLTYDQVNWEVIPNRKGEPAAWYAADAATIKLADTYRLAPAEDLDATRCVQIYDQVVVNEFSGREMLFEIRNPRTDIRSQGYGTSEIEMLVSTVTQLLWAINHNSNYFCISGGLRVTTDSGAVPVADLVGEKFQIWTGSGWSKAAAVCTGLRPLVRTTLWNGIELSTSPEHQFRVIPKSSLDGVAIWREQAELQPGDHVLMNPTPVEATEPTEDLLVGQTFKTKRSQDPTFTVTEELVRDVNFWEMIGFAIGDGHWPKSHGPLQIFPARGKEDDLRDAFLATCERHGINARITEAHASGDYIAIHHKAFIDWLYAIGFRSSSEGKRIPEVVFRSPKGVRCAVLRGLFSADGHRARHVTGYCTPTIHKTDATCRQDILQCLWSVGVAANSVGSGRARTGQIRVQDVPAFVARVGYLQDFKNADIRRAPEQIGRWDRLHPATALMVARQAKAHPSWLELSQSDRAQIGQVAQGTCGLSRPKALKVFDALGVDIPEVLSLCHVPIDVVDSAPVGEEVMYDIEVFDDQHLFFAGGVAVHNSQGTAVPGILNLKGAIPEKQMRAFRREWFQMISGNENAWRTPITNAESIDWIPMLPSNQDMEFSHWLDFLIKISCGVFQMDPIEINFSFSSGGKRSMFGGADKAKVVESQQKGLRPLLRFFESIINRWLIWPINPNFVIEFIGLEMMTPKELADLNTQRVRTLYTIDEMRFENDLEPLPEGRGEVILDANWLAHDRQLQEQAQQHEQELAQIKMQGQTPAAAEAEAPTTPKDQVPGQETPPAPASVGKLKSDPATPEQIKELEALLQPSTASKSLGGAEDIVTIEVEL